MAAGVTSPERRVQILVVDDEPGVRLLVCRMLAQGGYGTCEAADGAEALASLRAGLAVDLVLSDVAMRQLNRIQLLEALSVSHPDLPALPDLITITLVRSTPVQRSRPEPERLSSRRPRSERRLRGAPPNRARLR